MNMSLSNLQDGGGQGSLDSHDRERPYIHSASHSLAGGLLHSETYSPSSNKATGVETCWEKVTQDTYKGLEPERMENVVCEYSSYITLTMNFQMFKLDLEKAEEPEIKLPTSIGS